VVTTTIWDQVSTGDMVNMIAGIKGAVAIIDDILLLPKHWKNLGK
jgi:preprotein translocase subunit YajC